jgi:hypothetical protein
MRAANVALHFFFNFLGSYVSDTAALGVLCKVSCPQFLKRKCGRFVLQRLKNLLAKLLFSFDVHFSVIFLLVLFVSFCRMLTNRILIIKFIMRILIGRVNFWKRESILFKNI